MKQQTNEPQPQPQQDSNQADHYENGKASVWELIASVIFGGKGK